LGKKFLKNLNIDKDWTLFLDRDGVINYKIENDYVKNWLQFKFLPDALKAIKGLSKIFGKIIIVTNQRGIGRGLMTEKDLLEVHRNMLKNISGAGGRIDKIYYCPYDIDDNSRSRKPNIGMALQAKKDFPEIVFSKSIMVGDSLSDMEFGKKSGMLTIFISKNLKHNSTVYNADFVFKDLFSMYSEIIRLK